MESGPCAPHDHLPSPARPPLRGALKPLPSALEPLPPLLSVGPRWLSLAALCAPRRAKSGEEKEVSRPWLPEQGLLCERPSLNGPSHRLADYDSARP